MKCYEEISHRRAYYERKVFAVIFISIVKYKVIKINILQTVKIVKKKKEKKKYFIL